MIIVVGNLITKVVADDYFCFAFDWTKIDEYVRLVIQIHVYSITQHDIITSQREIFLPFIRENIGLYFPCFHEADKRAYFLGYIRHYGK